MATPTADRRAPRRHDRRAGFLTCSREAPNLGGMLRTLLVVALVLPAAAARSAEPTDGDKQEARRWYDVGRRALDGKQFEKAALAFDEAYALDPTPPLLWNAARAYDLAGDAQTARDRYLSFVALAGARQDLREWAAARIKQLEARPKDPDPAPPAPDPEVDPRPDPDEPPDGLTSPPDVGPPPERVAGWVTLGLGAAALIAGAVTAGHGEMLRAEIDDLPRDEDGVIIGPTQVEVEAQAAQAERELNGGVITVGAGGVLVIVGTVLLLTSPDGEPEDAPARPTVLWRPGDHRLLFAASGRF